jgi:hypothetical protein
MSEDQRISRNPSEPAKGSGLSTPGLWSAYLDWQRGDLLAGVRSLGSEDQRRSVVPSGWTPLELLSHVAHMEQRWFVWGFLGEPVAAPWGDWDGHPARSDTARWRVDTSFDEVAAQLETVAARTREVLASYPLDALAATGGRFDTDPPSLEWICFHVLAEYARHAGHLDLAVELLTDPTRRLVR